MVGNMLNKGETVWFINTCWTAESVGVQYIEKGTVIATDGIHHIIEPFKIFSNNEIGKLVFKSKLEADTALKKSIKK